MQVYATTILTTPGPARDSPADGDRSQDDPPLRVALPRAGGGVIKFPRGGHRLWRGTGANSPTLATGSGGARRGGDGHAAPRPLGLRAVPGGSEEHTSELQSPTN